MKSLFTAVVIAVCQAMIARGASVDAQKPLRDAKLEQLKELSLPRIFTTTEMSTIDGQMDVLKLGIDLFLAQDIQIPPKEQQAAFNDAWPLLGCLFKADFERNLTPHIPIGNPKEMPPQDELQTLAEPLLPK